MVLLISHISAVSRNVKSQSVSISSRTNANLLSSVKVGMSTLSLSVSKLYHLLIAYATNKLKPLKHWDDKRMNSRKFGHILEFSRPLQKNTRTRCSTQKSDIVIFMPRHQKVAGYYVKPSEILSVRPSVCLSVRPSVRQRPPPFLYQQLLLQF